MARVEKSIEINVPVRTAYNQMTQFEQFPRFMDGVQSVTQLDDTHLHWHSKSDGQDREWDAEITEQVPDHCIAWRNLTGKKNVGRIEFTASGDNSTRLTLAMEFQAEGTPAQAQQIDNLIAMRTEQDLARFKKLIESQGRENGAWRGEVHNAPMEGNDQHDQHDQRAQHARHAAPASPSAVQHSSQDYLWFQGVTDVWQAPLVVMRKMSEEMDHFFGQFIGRPLGMTAWSQSGGSWTPRVDVQRRDNEVVISADLPGIRSEDVHVQVRQDRLTIEGERHEKKEEQEYGFHRSEQVYGHFYREIPLPEGIDAQAAAASLQDGVLKITVPVMPQEQRARRIAVYQSHQSH